jgi:hypothetical protein
MPLDNRSSIWATKQSCERARVPRSRALAAEVAAQATSEIVEPVRETIAAVAVTATT